MTSAHALQPRCLHSEDADLQLEIWCARKENPSQKVGTKSLLEARSASGRLPEQQVPPAVIARCIDRQTKNHPLPPAIVRFLETHWRRYLLLTYAVDGEDSQRWRDALKTMDELTWSVRPKADPESRRRLFVLLPQMYQRLHLELKSLGLGTADQDIFFAELAKLHQAALYTQPSARAGSPSSKTQSCRAGEKAMEPCRDISKGFEDSAQVCDQVDTQSTVGPSSQIAARESKRSSGASHLSAQLWSDPTQIWFR